MALRIIKIFIAVFIISALPKTIVAQTEYAERTFYDTRIINGHSVETGTEGVMKFIIAHRFGSVNSGIYDFFGLDDANMRIGLDYAIRNWLTIGAGRSSFEKTYDGYFKFRLFRQSHGDVNFPVSITWFSGTALKGIRPADPQREYDPVSNLYYSHQLLIARKFGNAFSLQIMPTLIHRNFVEMRTEKHDVVAIGIAPRLQISKSLTLSAEYYYLAPDQLNPIYYNSLAIGIDFETKGHVFQLNFGNSRGLIEKVFVTETEDTWSKANIHFGFNITRDFKLKGRPYRKYGDK